MKAEPLVSVIVIFYNAERFIREAIESVIAQTYRNWELLLIDDGSTDRSTEIGRTYAGRHPERVYYFEHEGHRNRGASPSRNVGIRNAKGSYLAFLDSDDVWLPEKLDQQVAILEAHPDVGMVYGRSVYWYSWTGNTLDAARDNIPELSIAVNTIVNPPDMILHCYPLGNATAPPPSDIMVRREAAARADGFEESFTSIYQLYEDQAFLSKVYLSECIFIAGEIWDKYRQHDHSCVSQVTSAGQYHTVRRYYLEWFEHYLLRRGYRNKAVWNALYIALLPYRHPIHYRLYRLVSRIRRIPYKLKAIANLALKRKTITGNDLRGL